MLLGFNVIVIIFLFEKCGVVMGIMGIVMILVFVIGLIFLGYIV